MAEDKSTNALVDSTLLFSHLKLSAGMTVADLGCGTSGQFVVAAAKLVGETGLVYAVDILKSALQAAVSRSRLAGLNNVKSVWSNLEIYGATKIAEQSLDAAFLINTLYQSENKEAIIKEAVRLIKSGGHLLVVDWSKDKEFFGLSVDRKVDVDEIKKNASDQKLKLIDQFAASQHHFGLVFKK
ncbi:MAG: class I SAM-dependent methyltransferase [Candidatus Buchananbacteria bacterium]|nr:class I SAM-dependent methyltransferase [Candidatus Buchananbacteria bacterium]